MDPKFQSLMERMNQLGQLLPAAEDIDLDDPNKVAEVQIVLDEFNKAKAELDAFLLEQRQKREQERRSK
jgi:hypothetical protein